MTVPFKTFTFLGIKFMPASLSQFSGDNSNRANTAFMIGFFTILAAWAFELIGGYQPCELCLGERTPYYIGLPVLAITIGMWKQIAPIPRLGLTLFVAAIFVWSIYLGLYHAGVEWEFWPGPTACTGGADAIDFSALGAINDVRVIPCDTPQFRFFWISFAGYNALISALVVFFLLWSAKGQIARIKHNAKI